MAGSRSGTIVAGITATALAVVAFLAYQASATAPDGPMRPRSGSGSATASGKPGAPAASGAQTRKPPAPHHLPTASGTGVRVVYALGDRRVWLVGPNDRIVRTYEATPSSVSPRPGQYAVTSRSASITGSDGVPVEHIVRFAAVDGVVVGFSAALDGSMPDPNGGRKTGGIRESRADGTALWNFATVGTKVVVVP